MQRQFQHRSCNPWTCELGLCLLAARLFLKQSPDRSEHDALPKRVHQYVSRGTPHFYPVNIHQNPTIDLSTPPPQTSAQHDCTRRQRVCSDCETRLRFLHLANKSQASRWQPVRVQHTAGKRRYRALCSQHEEGWDWTRVLLFAVHKWVSVHILLAYCCKLELFLLALV